MKGLRQRLQVVLIACMQANLFAKRPKKIVSTGAVKEIQDWLLKL